MTDPVVDRIVEAKYGPKPSPCPICTERPDVGNYRTLKYHEPRDPEQHSVLSHTEFAQLAWELDIYKEDNPDEWKELKRVTREGTSR